MRREEMQTWGSTTKERGDRRERRGDRYRTPERADASDNESASRWRLGMNWRGEGSGRRSASMNSASKYDDYEQPMNPSMDGRMQFPPQEMELTECREQREQREQRELRGMYMYKPAHEEEHKDIPKKYPGNKDLQSLIHQTHQPQRPHPHQQGPHPLQAPRLPSYPPTI